jgi:site-specific DNA-methyltransferase (adenine-specific)
MRVRQRSGHGPQQLRLGDQVRERRLKLGLTLAEVAQLAGVTKGYLSRVERGHAKPSKKLVDQMARILRTEAGPLQVLAGHLPHDVEQILYAHPQEAPAMLRETFAEYTAGKPPVAQLAQDASVRHPRRRGATAPENVQGLYELVHGDCLEWLERREPESVHAVVTDPPYGLKEYTSEEKAKLRKGRGGVWRIPPKLDGHERRPLPRFTILTGAEKLHLRCFFREWAQRTIRVLVPGAHIFIASNPLVSHLVYLSLEEAGFEKRGEVIRLVQTLRGGDRPKNAHDEFDMVTVMPRSCWEPWGLFRKPCEGRVQDNLRKWKTGGLRRPSLGRPFCDVVQSSPTRGIERDIAPHPSLKPQAFMRQVVYAALPLGKGVILDPFMGGGSTIAAACAVGYRSIGVELDSEFYDMARQAVPRLARLRPNGNGSAASGPMGDVVPVQHGLFG